MDVVSSLWQVKSRKEGSIKADPHSSLSECLEQNRGYFSACLSNKINSPNILYYLAYSNITLKINW